MVEIIPMEYVIIQVKGMNKDTIALVARLSLWSKWSK